MKEAVLTPRDLALAIGVSESSLKRWADEGRLTVSRTAGGHRRILLTDAVRFVRETHATVVRPDLLGLPEVGSVASQLRLGSVGDPTTVLYESLAAGDGPRVRGLILAWFLEGQSLPALFDGPIRNAMHQLGELWQQNIDGIYIEHRATDLCAQALHHLRSLLPPPADNAPVAIGGARAADPYLLPSLMACITLADMGWRAINLGPDSPHSVLLSAARSEGAQLMWLSVTAPADPKVLAAEAHALAADLLLMRCNLVLGGRQFDQPPINLFASGIHTAHSMKELAAYASGLLAAPR